VVRGEHVPEHGHHAVEAAVREGHPLRVPLHEVDLDHRIGRALARDLEQRGREVEPGHPRARLRRRDRRVTGAARHVQHVHAGADAAALHDHLAGVRDALRDGRVVS
jgi:hypothetical protein